MIAADFANFARIPTDADIAALKALGTQRTVIGASYPWDRTSPEYVADAQLAACADFERQVYGWVKFDDSNWQHPLLNAMLAHDRASATAFWNDVEEEPAGSLAGNTEAVRQRIRDAIAFTGSCDIYTRVELWNRITGNWNIVQEYPNARLWKADPPPDDGLCGGFDHATMIQTDFDTDIGTGFEVDLSEYEEEQMDQQTKDAIAAILQQQGELGTKIDALEASTKYLISVVVNVAGRVSTLEGK